ncbi:unnamed protein product [Protopolystoma xenopodis]|uniref:Uncharacterized protein n=1 Tax=Protopolystoma xenopodis TaxID=117903 RepID=A0A448WDM7_9PLAT|nr:unnamed protein product [Protopolystoma xenopodis]
MWKICNILRPSCLLRTSFRLQGDNDHESGVKLDFVGSSSEEGPVGRELILQTGPSGLNCLFVYFIRWSVGRSVGRSVSQSVEEELKPGRPDT